MEDVVKTKSGSESNNEGGRPNQDKTTVNKAQSCWHQAVAIKKVKGKGVIKVLNPRTGFLCLVLGLPKHGYAIGNTLEEPIDLTKEKSCRIRKRSTMTVVKGVLNLALIMHSWESLY